PGPSARGRRRTPRAGGRFPEGAWPSGIPYCPGRSGRYPWCSSGAVQFGENLPGDPETVDARRDTGVHGNLQEYLADLVAGHTVVECPLDVGAQFVRPVEYREHRESEHRPDLRWQT